MPQGPEDYLKIEKVARILDTTVRTLRRWVKEGKFPAPVRVAGVKRWRAVEIQRIQEEALEARARERISGGTPGQTGPNVTPTRKRD